jgi:hypothetical protein
MMMMFVVMIFVDFVYFEAQVIPVTAKNLYGGSTQMALKKIGDETFVDVAGLLFAEFEQLESDPKATLMFTSGQTMTISGNSASALHSFLNPESQPPSRSTPSLLEDVEAVAINAFAESDRIEFTAMAPMVRKKAWYHRSDKATNRSFFMAFVNAKGSCTLRMFDAGTGIAFPKQGRSGNYQDQFRELIQGAVELTVPSQPNLERDCKERLPQSTLGVLRSQIS